MVLQSLQRGTAMRRLRLAGKNGGVRLCLPSSLEFSESVNDCSHHSQIVQLVDLQPFQRIHEVVFNIDAYAELLLFKL